MTATITPEHLVAVDDLPDLDAVLPCELLDRDSAGAEVQCDQPATILLELTCPIRHAACTEQLLVCAEHDEWITKHSFQLLVTIGLIVVKRVPL